MEEKKVPHEIDILALVGRVLKEWKLLLKFVSVAAILGIIIAVNTPKTFKAEVMLAPELASGGLGLNNNLADMASNFGIDIGKKSSMDAIYPELYPNIFSSTDFILKLFDVPVRLKNDNKPRTYLTHITQEQKIPFWNYPKVWIANILTSKASTNNGEKKHDEFKISKKDDEICHAIRDAILCTIDKKTSVITITVTDQDPLVAAILADTLQSRLQAYITNYQTKKARDDYNYYRKMTMEAKAQYQKAQQLYAAYHDANMDVQLETFKAKTDQLENEMQLKYNMYTHMAAQLEQAQAKVQARTPAFTIIQKPIMPYKASSTPRSGIVIMFAFLGAVMDALWILYGRDFLGK